MQRGLSFAFVVLLLVGFILPDQGQQNIALSKRASAVREKARQLSPDAHISVLPLNAREAYGRFISSDNEEFTFYDIDEKANVILKYEAVKKIKNGYGGYNHAVHRHTDRRQGLIIGLAVAGGLAALIGAAAALR